MRTATPEMAPLLLEQPLRRGSSTDATFQAYCLSSQVSGRATLVASTKSGEAALLLVMLDMPGAFN